MALRQTIATTNRVLRQLTHDARTLALLFIVPSALLLILKYVFYEQAHIFDSLAPMLLGIFPMIMMFLVTSITTLRERKNGTLDRLLSMPVGKLDFIGGYAIAFSIVALLQACVTAATLLGILGINVAGGTLATIVGAVAAAMLGTALGLFSSAFATTEFQAIQFMPVFMFPQLLLCGLFVPRDHMAAPLQWVANILPLSYSVEAMQQVTMFSEWTTTHTRDLLIILVCTIAALLLGALTIRRQQQC